MARRRYGGFHPVALAGAIGTLEDACYPVGHDLGVRDLLSYVKYTGGLHFPDASPRKHGAFPEARQVAS